MRSSRSNSSASGSTEDSSNADSSGSSVEKDPPVKDGRQLNGSVGQIGQRRASVKSTGSNRSVKSGAKREERKNSHGSEKWKLQLDESGSGSVSDNEASDAGGVTGSTAPSAGNTVKEQAENMKDGNVSSDESDFQGFESTGSETEGLEILSSIIGNCEATDGVGIPCLNCDDVITAPTEVVSADSSPVRAEPERERTPVRLMGSPRITSQVRGRGRPRSAGSASSTSSSGVRSGSFGGKRSAIDLTNPAYRKPLEMGWKRELVYRNTGDASSRRMCDIYYYTPMGKKVRSGKEVMENLDGDLTIENFTFFKEPLGVNDPSKEIIRDARRISIGGKDTSPIVGGSLAVKRQAKPKAQQVASPSPAPAPAKQSLIPKVETLVPKVKEEEDLSKDRPPDSSPPAAAPTPTAQTPPSVDKPPPAVAGPSGMQNKNMQPCVMLSRSFPRIKVANKVTPNKRQTRPLVSPRAGDMEMGMLPPQWKDKQGSSVLSSPGARQISQVKMVRSLKGVRPAGVPTPRASAPVTGRTVVTVTASPATTPTTDIGKKFDVCTIQCPGMNGAVPSLQCRVCLCLYHTKCAGLGSIQGTIHGYVCKKCQLEAKKTVIVSSPTSVTVPLSNTSPPPLTPIRMMTPQPPTLTRPAAPGTRAQLISPPQPTHRPALVPTVPTLVRVSRPEARTKGTATVSATTAVTPASIVGSVTTWLPPSSRVSVARATVSSSPTVSFSTTSTSCAIPSTRPAPPVSQGLVRVGGRRYVVMPKHNVLSVSGTSASKQRDLRPKPSPQQQQQQTAASAFLVGGQNPPGVLLVPVLGPSQVTDRRPQSVLLVNGGTVLATPPIASKDAAVENRKRKAEAEDGVVSKKPRPMEVASNDPNLELHKFMQGFMSHLTSGYNAMLHVFEYLKVQELLRASRVCRLWRSLATHESLWRTVRLKNSPIADWKGCAAALARCGTRHLDMRKMLVPTGRAEDWWASFGANIGRVPSLESVELSRCPAAVVERVAQQCPQLITLSALSIRDQSINLSSVGQLKNLQELRIKNLSGMYINGKLDGLKELTNLKHLSLTMVKNLGHAGCAVLGELNTLETLEIGECCDLPSSFGNQTLSRLSSLHRLRLEKGQGDSCPTFSLLGGVRTLPALVTLELINFDVKPGFDAALARCTNVRRLLIIPTYISQSATTNHTVLSGVTKLGESLTHLVWGVTHELLRVTELFVDQCEDQKVPTYRKKSTEEGGSSAGDSIPVLRPVPGCTPSGDAPDGSPGVGSEWNSGSVSGSQPTGAPQVDILPLTKLQKMLNTSLPRTKIKILKVPFQATWRQYISDSDF